MHPKRIKKVLSDEDTLDIGQTAEAVQSFHSEKPKSRLNSTKAHTAWLIRKNKEELLRQKIKDAWNKRKQK